MRRRERVVHIDIAELGECARKIGRILFLSLIEAQIFEQRDLSRPKIRDDPLRRLADAVSCFSGSTRGRKE